MQHRSDDIRCDGFDAPAKLVGNLGDRQFVGQRAHDQLLQRPQLLVLADIAQQGEYVFDASAIIAKRLDGGRDPDLIAVPVVGENFLLVAAAVADPAAQPEQGLAVGQRSDKQLVGMPSLHFRGRVSQHSGERRVGIDDAQVAIGDDDGAGGLVGHQVQKRDPLAPFDLGGDVANKDHIAASAADLDARGRYGCSKPAAIGAPDGDFGMRREVGKPETACIEAKDILAADAPDRFRRSVEMADMQVAVDDDDSLARLFERRQQELCRVDRGAIGGVHRLTL